MDEIEVLRERAARCRRLALTRDDAEMLNRLSELAEEYDSEALALAAQRGVSASPGDRG